MKNYDVAPLEGFHPETGILLASLLDSTREWRENLGKPPVDAIVWQPWPRSYNIGALILHLMECEVYWFEVFAAGRPFEPEEVKLLLSQEIQQYGGHWPTPHAKPLTWYYELQDRLRARSFEALREIEPTKVYERKNYTATLRWVVAHVVQHDSYHGGQAVLLHEMWKKSGRPKRPR